MKYREVNKVTKRKIKLTKKLWLDNVCSVIGRCEKNTAVSISTRNLSVPPEISKPKMLT